MHPLSTDQLNKIHSASMGILQKTGVQFKNQEAVEIFKKNGFRVEGDVVFFEERHVQNAPDTAPASFRLVARNPDKNLTVGGDEFIFAPGYGAPFMVSVDGNQREAVIEDYHNFCKLVQIDSATLQEEVVARAEIGGEYLSQLETVNRCPTEFFFPWIMQGMEYEIY